MRNTKVLKYEKPNKNGSLIYFLTAIVLIVTISLTMVCGYLVYKNNILQIEEHVTEVGLFSTAKKIEKSIELGKSIDNYFGMEEILQSQCENIDNLENLAIYQKEDKILYSANEQGIESMDKVYENGKKFVEDGKFYTSIAFEKDHGFVMAIDGENIEKQLNSYLNNILKLMIILVIASIIILAILYFHNEKNRKLSEKLVRNICICILIIVQIVFGSMSFKYYLDGYTENIYKLGNEVANTIENDIRSLNEKGIPFEYIDGIDEYVGGFAEEIALIESLQLEKTERDNKTDSNSQATLEIEGEKYSLKTEISKSEMRANIFDFIISIGLVILVSILLIVEMNIALRGYEKHKKELSTISKKEFEVNNARIMILVNYAAINMGLAIGPIFASRLYDPTLGINKNIAIGMPITVEMFMGVLAILVSGVMLSNMGFKKIMIFATAITFVGLVASAFSEDLLTFTLSRAVVGFGYGLSTIITRTYSIMEEDADLRASKMANLSGGSLAGMCIGITLGGVLADYTSFGLVYGISAVIILFSCINIITLSFPKVSKVKIKDSINGFKKIISSYDSMKILAFVIFPTYACSVFVFYALPLIGDEYNMSAAMISALIMLNFLIAGYLSPSLTKFFIGRCGLRNSIIYAILLVVVPIILFVIYPGPITLVVAVIMFGLSDAFGVVAEIEEFSSTEGAKKASAIDGMIMITMTGKLGQAIAPTIMAITLGSSIGLGIFASAGLLLYMFTGKKTKFSKNKYKISK